LRAGIDVPATRNGYVQNVDVDRLQGQAAEGDLRIHVLAPPGAFVRCGEPLARVDGVCDQDRLREVRAAFSVGASRSFDQDPRYGLIVLGEIAARALSPGVNDPGTAIQVTGAGVRLLDEWARAEAEGEVDHDRVFFPEIATADLMDDVFSPVARYGAGDVAVLVRLKKALASLAVDGPFARHARDLARDLDARARKTLPIAADVRRVIEAGR
jgi:uncharacterized membrane protein